MFFQSWYIIQWIDNFKLSSLTPTYWCLQFGVGIFQFIIKINGEAVCKEC